jgi:hypothetical protein
MKKEFFFCNPILFAICTSTFSKLCKNMYTVACGRVLSRMIVDAPWLWLSEGISKHQQLKNKSAATALSTVLASAHIKMT